MDTELRTMELEAQLDAQRHSKKVAQIEIYRIKKRIEQLQGTMASLDEAISATEKELSEIGS
jgi:chromosome segregation ATPase